MSYSKVERIEPWLSEKEYNNNLKKLQKNGITPKKSIFDKKMEDPKFKTIYEKASAKINKSIKRGIKNVKEGKVTKVNEVEDLFKGFEERRKRHPIFYFFHDLYYRVYHFIESIPLNVKSFIQRGKQGYSSRDVWGFDLYLAGVISKGLYHLKRNMCGHPNDLTEGQWVDILNEIIYTFKTAKEIIDMNKIYVNSKEWNQKRYLELLRVNYKYGYPHIMTKKECIKFERGFDLFKKYFFSMWD